MIVIQQFTRNSPSCSYLPWEQSNTHFIIAADISPTEYETRMNAGWRKFGPMLFRPECPACTACQPIRIPVERFAPDRSQTRALKRNADLRVEFAHPTVDSARLALYQRYHQAQAVSKGWERDEKDAEDYAFQFLVNSIPSVEVSVWHGDTLWAVALADLTPNTVSAVYHYHEPMCRERSLGTFVILHTVELARRLGKQYVYLGYYVAGCRSMEYKTRYRPSEILGTSGNWDPLKV